MMSFMMTATPLNMHSVDGHGLLDTKWVIQSHIIAMFAPSFFSGWLISRLGQRRVIVAGVLVYLACIAIALSGRELLHYWWALVLLGIGWNFLFVGGTALLPLCHRPTERFKVQTLNEFAVFGTQSLAALSSGWVVNTWGWEVLVLLSSLMVCAILLALWLSASGVRETRAA
jgi:MFS family permease